MLSNLFNLSINSDISASLADGQILQKIKLEDARNVNLASIVVVKLTADTAKQIDLGGIITLNLLAIKSSSPVDLSLLGTPSDVWLGVRSSYVCLHWPAGQAVDHIKIKSAAAAQAEIFLAGS